VTEDHVDRLQSRLGPALEANRPGSGIDHVIVVLPSYSVSESILSHYGDRMASLEHRYLNSLLVADRIPDAEVLFLSTRRPDDDEIAAVLSALPEDRRRSVRNRLHLFAVDDGTARPVATKVLDRPELLVTLRQVIGTRPALIEPWNVTEPEIALALALDVPINGTRPELRPLAFKSAGRMLMRSAGVPVPEGREDVRSVKEIVEAALAIRAARPDAAAIVVKLDDSGAGDGNVVLDLPPRGDDAAVLRRRASGLPTDYLEELSRGGVVEERITGAQFSSPSAQVDIRPDGEVIVLATHEQVLGGPGDQVYLGCRFPADSAYAKEVGQHAAAVGHALAERGALGRFSLDFVVARDANDAPWRVYGIEVNLRKGGTTHPYAALRSVVPGHYDVEAGRWMVDGGGTRYYTATDNVVDARWKGLPPGDVVRAVSDAGLLFDPASRTGAVLHMLAGLAVDGRFGLTAIAETREAGDELEAAVRSVVNRLTQRSPRPKRVSTPGE
jgi:hypothetical protein